MFDKVTQRFAVRSRPEQAHVRFLIKHHLRSSQYSDQWTDSAVRRFHREMAPHLRDLLDLSRADITSKRPGRRQRDPRAQISALSERAWTAWPRRTRVCRRCPAGSATRSWRRSSCAPSRMIGDLKRHLEAAVAAGALEARRDDAYYVAHLARAGMAPGIAPERRAAVLAGYDLAEPERDDSDDDGDPERPRPGVLACGHDPDNDPCAAERVGAFVGD
jgi:hypothetical protein